MKFYNGGSDKDDLLISETGNSAPSPVTSLRNQVFIKFFSEANGVGKGFTAKIIFGNIITTWGFLFLQFHFNYVIDNLCQNALDLINGKLIVDNNWPVGTYCQWLISAEDESSYITLEFENINVS